MTIKCRPAKKNLRSRKSEGLKLQAVEPGYDFCSIKFKVIGPYYRNCKETSETQRDGKR